MGTKLNKVVFKLYIQNQIQLLPPSLDELVDEKHPCRIVNEVIEKIDIRPINRKYKGGGASSYHPRLLLKVLVYGYLTNAYSSRKLEEQVKQNIYFMWLCGMKTPDHNTINRFRGEKLFRHTQGDLFSDCSFAGRRRYCFIEGGRLYRWYQD